MKSALNHKNKWLTIALSVLAMAGCGDKGKASFSLTPVTGTITLDGQPLPEADIVFHYKGTAPEGYNGAASRSDANGVFQIKAGKQLGILPGLHKVTVTRNESDGPPVVPKKYGSPETSDLELRVSTDRSTGYALELASTTE